MNSLLASMDSATLQQYICHLGQSSFHEGLGLDRNEAVKYVREHGCLLPTEHVKKVISESRCVILEELCNLGSISELSKHYGVSSSFMRTQLSPNRFNRETHLPFVISEIKKYQSISFACRINRWSESQVRQLLKKEQVVLECDFSHTMFANAKGRRGEKLFAALRGEHIKEDMNVKDSQADWDYVDDELGKVQVKSSAPYSYKSHSRNGENFWKFSTSETIRKSDTLILVLCNKDFSVAHKFVIVPVSYVPEKQRGLTITSRRLESLPSSSLLTSLLPTLDEFKNLIAM